MAATKQAAPQRPSVLADRQRPARPMAYLGCAGAVGYGGLKVIWALGGTVGLRDPGRFHLAPAGLTAAQRFFDYWGTPILAGLAVVILLGLVYPWGNMRLVRPLLRTLAWAGSLLSVAGVAGLILTGHPRLDYRAVLRDQRPCVQDLRVLRGVPGGRRLETGQGCRGTRR
jgi:hypothetical protein